MALIRREPARTEMEPFFGRGLFGWPEWLTAWEPFRGLMEAEQIKVEEFVEGDQYVVRAELPGIDPEKDVEITVTDRTLHIRAERRQEKKTEEPRYHRQEIRYGSFSRSLQLPEGASEKDVSASYTDGILTVRLPIDREKAAATRIPITRG
jgi:HSP20 family protein